jgi:hypothetical protein
MNSTFDTYFFNLSGDDMVRPERASIFDAIDAAILSNRRGPPDALRARHDAIAERLCP